MGVFWGEFTRREPEAAARLHRQLLDAWISGGVAVRIAERYELERASATRQLAAVIGQVRVTSSPREMFRINWPAVVEEAKQRRKEQKLTQKRLARLAGVSMPTISRFESGSEDIQLLSVTARLE